MFPTPLRRATLVGSLVLTFAMTPSLTRAAVAAGPVTSSATATTEHAALRDAIWRLEKSLRRRLAAAERGLRPAAVETSATEHPRNQRDRLDALRRAARRLGPAGAELVRKAWVLEPLVDEVQQRERAGASAQPASAWSVDAASGRLATVASAACGEAATIGAGRFLVEVGGSGRADVWLQHRADVAGMLLVSTAGSELDTVVEVYDGCPAAGAQPVAAGDDEVGLQARAARRVAAGETSWIRVSGWEGARGTAIVAIVDAASGFIGTVTRQDNGQPLDRYVYAWTSGGSYASSTRTASDGTYFIAGLSAGSYFASTAPPYYADGLLDELYDGQPCPSLQGCNPTTGTPIPVTSGSIVTGIDFALGPGGEITGRVRDAATGTALAYAEVSIYSAAGNHLDDVDTDVAGRYTIGGLGTATFYAVAEGDYGTQYQPELYYGIDCPSYSCTVTNGTPIPVTIGQTTTGIDFTLVKLGAIAGTLTQVQGGAPIPYGEVDVWDSLGNFVRWAYVNSSGQYSVGGLAPGNYFVRTYTGDFVDELYDNLPCNPGCPAVTTGTPVAVTIDHTTAGINFALRREGSISGSVTDASNGTPVATYSVYLSVFDNSGSFVDSDYAYNGEYSFTGLAAGSYYVHASAELYRPELYNDVPCPGGPPSGCSFASGTPVVTQIDVPTTGINFALTRLGSIAGTVSDQATAAPLNSATVYVWNAAGTSVAYGYTSGGAYKVDGLPAGTYYVTAQAWEYQPELYNNLNCPGGGPPTCNPAGGTPVSVSLATTTSGINFTLTRKGSIAGTVRDLATAAPIYADISVYTSGGAFVASTYASAGAYEVKGLDAGSYRVVARNSGYSARLYNGLPCPPGSCNPAIGTPVSVTLGATTGGIDFNLPRLGAISGTVRSDAGPLSSINVGLYDANGNLVGFTYTGADGRYQLSADQGNWYLIAGVYSSDYVAELYSDIPCPNNSCNVASGTPVGVALGVTTPGIDFKLDPSRGILGCVVNEAGQPLVGVAIDLWSPAGTHLATAVTGTSGCYRHLPNNSGTYYVSTDSGLPLVDEVWNDVACPQGSAYAGLCNPTAGTPINLPNWNSLVTGVDFALGVGRIFRSGFESGDAAWLFWP